MTGMARINYRRLFMIQLLWGKFHLAEISLNFNWKFLPSFFPRSKFCSTSEEFTAQLGLMLSEFRDLLPSHLIIAEERKNVCTFISHWWQSTEVTKKRLNCSSRHHGSEIRDFLAVLAVLGHVAESANDHLLLTVARVPGIFVRLPVPLDFSLKRDVGQPEAVDLNVDGDVDRRRRRPSGEFSGSSEIVHFKNSELLWDERLASELVEVEWVVEIWVLEKFRKILLFLLY